MSTPPWQASTTNLMGSMTATPLVRTDYGTQFADCLAEKMGGIEIEVL